MVRTSRRSAVSTPSPEAAERTSGVAPAALASAFTAFFRLLLGKRVGLAERNDLRLLSKAAAIGLQLGAHGPVGAGRVLAGDVDQMQQHAAALDMAEEARAEAGALMGALDEAGNVGEHEIVAVAPTTPRLGWSVVKG